MTKPADELSIFNTDVLTALSDEARQNIIILLVKVRAMRAGDIAQQFSLTRSSISHHLQILKRANIVLSRKDGKEIYYSIHYSFICQQLSCMTALFEKYRQIHD